MAVEVSLNNIGSGYNRTIINDNFTAITSALEDAFSRSGNSPNVIEVDVDLDGNDLLNVGAVNAEQLFIDGVEYVFDEAIEKGDSGTITVGTVTTGAAGTNAIVTNVGTDTDAILNFTIPRGDTGASGAGTGDMLAAQNLNDLASKPTAKTNLGLGIGDSPQFTGIELGHATDTTLTRSSAGNVAVEGNIVYRAGGTDVPLADGGTGASLTDPNADRLMFWDDSAGAVTWLTPGTGLTLTDTTLSVSTTGGVAEYTPYQPSSDTNIFSTTGLGGYKIVEVYYALHANTATANIQLSCRSSGGTWRDLGIIGYGASGRSGTRVGRVKIVGVNNTYDAKIVIADNGWNGITLDMSDAINSTGGDTSLQFAPSWNEVWDELKITMSSGDFAGSTTDRRGIFYVYGYY